jgi:hypothetical protein
MGRMSGVAAMCTHVQGVTRRVFACGVCDYRHALLWAGADACGTAVVGAAQRTTRCMFAWQWLWVFAHDVGVCLSAGCLGEDGNC